MLSKRQSVLALRRFLSQGVNRSSQRPEPHHLQNVQEKLAAAVFKHKENFQLPEIFRQRMDYSFYRKDVILEDTILNTQKQCAVLIEITVAEVSTRLFAM